jgi:peptidoglycan/LPS O-acetylase OafA/YrhL
MQGTTGTQPSKRALGLDVLRGVAVLLVLVHHPAVEPHTAGVFTPLAIVMERFGWTGVDLFFVLSGFLVGGLLFKEIKATGRLDVKRFLIRRGFKIWPSYFLFLAVAFVQQVRNNHSDSIGMIARQWLPNLVHVQNYRDMTTPVLLYVSHTWSLAVEEHFYLALPLLLLLLLKSRRTGGPVIQISAIPLIAAALVIGCLALRLVQNLNAALYVPYHQLTPTHLRIDSLFLGVLLAYLTCFQQGALAPLIRHKHWLVVAGVVLVSPMLYFRLEDRFTYTIGYTLLLLGYGAILLAIVNSPGMGEGVARSVASVPARAVAMAGFFSYSIYLWHPNLAQRYLITWMSHGLFGGLNPSLRWVVGMLVYIALSFAVGALMAGLIEIPGLLIRERWFPARTKPAFAADKKDVQIAQANLNLVSS